MSRFAAPVVIKSPPPVAPKLSPEEEVVLLHEELDRMEKKLAKAKSKTWHAERKAEEAKAAKEDAEVDSYFAEKRAARARDIW